MKKKQKKKLVKTFMYLISFLINFYIYNFIKIKYCSYVCALKVYVWCVKCLRVLGAGLVRRTFKAK